NLVLSSVRELDWGPYEQRTRSTDKRTFPSRTDAPPKLVLLRDGEIVKRHVLENRRVLIGRDADNDLPVASEFISRHHAQISFYRGAYWVMDLKSTNGTFVNGKRIRRCRLNDRDVIALGHHRVVFQNPFERAASESDDKTAHLSDFQGTSVLDPDQPLDAPADENAIDIGDAAADLPAAEDDEPSASAQGS
ncbi:MAG: FHA domain-containing protein, partial [Pseudomonadota bacterium]